MLQKSVASNGAPAGGVGKYHDRSNCYVSSAGPGAFGTRYASIIPGERNRAPDRASKGGGLRYGKEAGHDG
jgi:hypothetical protein